jgi:hypothetical protein
MAGIVKLTVWCHSIAPITLKKYNLMKKSILKNQTQDLANVMNIPYKCQGLK